MRKHNKKPNSKHGDVRLCMCALIGKFCAAVPKTGTGSGGLGSAGWRKGNRGVGFFFGGGEEKLE